MFETGIELDNLGARLKLLRLDAGLSLRELARQAEVSPSFVSQIENGKSQPSVATLYTFSRLLNVPVDELFGEDAATGEPGAPSETDPATAWHASESATRVSIVHPSHRPRLDMAAGVEWERLAATPERAVNFMKIRYAPGASSTDNGEPVSHEGYEYGYVLAGELEVTVGEEKFLLNVGESLGFDSRIMHSLRNPGDVDFEGIWFVHGRTH